MLRTALCLIPFAALAACGEIDTSALREVEEAAASARAATQKLNDAAALAEKAAEDPGGALRDATLGARFTRVATAEPNLYVLTDIATGCQYLAAYAADGATVQSITPRTAGSGAQHCVAPREAAALTPPDAASLVGRAIGVSE